MPLNKTRLRIQIAEAATRIMPPSLNLALYKMAFATLRQSVGMRYPKLRISVWARNSLRLGNLQPLLSDIDYTLLFEETPAREQLTRVVEHLATVKKAIPILGEGNVYFKADLPRIAAAINLFELDRDPELKALLRSANLIQPPVEGNMDAFAFLARMFEYDRVYLHRCPELRRRKWARHLESTVGSRLSPATPLVTGVLETLAELLPASLSERVAMKRSMELYFQRTEQGVPLHAMDADEQTWSWWFSIFPHRFCFLPERLRRLSEPQLRILESQLRWEAFAYFSQSSFRLEPAKVAGHFESLHGLAEKLVALQPEAAPVVRDCGNLLSIVRADLLEATGV